MVASTTDFTYISTMDKSVIDYICVPYEQMELVKDFEILTMTEVINTVKPDTVPDHSLLLCDLFTQSSQVVNSCDVDQDIDPLIAKKYKFAHLTDDFLCNNAISDQINKTIDTIEHSIHVSGDVQVAYDAFENLLHDIQHTTKYKHWFPFY